MAQSVRRPKTLEAVDHTLPRENKRTSYFGNVKNRLGSKLPAGVSQGPEFAGGRLEPCPRERDAGEAAADGGRPRPQPAAERPPGHSHRIRNPRLRQYYLQGTSLESNTPVQQEKTSALTLDATTSEAPPGDTVFSITSQIGSASHGYAIKVNRDPSSASTLFPEMRLHVPMARSTSAARNSSAAELQPRPRSELESPPLPASPPSPSPDTEYDKLLDVEAVPMPDGRLCLLTLPPECSQGDGPEAVPYLKLFCRYITDCKGVVSGVLLVTPNKTFFDPCKSHPLVTEHGCEEYLLSCSIDCLASVSFFSDITHIHFNSSQHRWKGKKSAKCPAALRGLQGPASHQKTEASWSVVSAGSSELQPAGASEDEGSDSRDMAETEEHLNRLSARATRSGPPAGALGVAVLSNAATFCCGAQRVGSNVRMELLRSGETELTNQTAVPGKQPPCGTGGLMFVRLRAQRTAGPKKVFGIQQGTSRTLSRRDAWFALSQQSSDELRAYLSHWRPELTVVEGGAVEREAEGDDEEFVLIEDSAADEDQRDRLRRPRRSGDDWEMVSMEDSGNRPALVFDREPECLSEIVEESSILEASHVRELCAELPPRTIGHAWQLTFSTSRHGSSLRALYRKLSDTDSPVLIVIKDALHQVFGSFLSHPLRPSETFYGTGETFLFMLHPRFKCFRWTGENTFFIKGNLDSFAVGGGSGHFGLWLDETLYLGRSSPCYTFNNCCLSETDDFRVMELEVWTFS